VTKLWNVARFCERFLEHGIPDLEEEKLTPADRWIRASLDRLVRKATDLMEAYEYASAKSEIETFFWTELADNYLEMAKQRLYDMDANSNPGARATLHTVLLTCLKLFAPFLPYITEAIYLELFSDSDPHGSPPGQPTSIHTSSWPEPMPELPSEIDLLTGEALVAVATAARRYKSEHNLPLSTELHELQLGGFAGTNGAMISDRLVEAYPDISSITRAREIEIVEHIEMPLELIQDGERFRFEIAIQA
jgi:valyl-tRNA synthetase